MEADSARDVVTIIRRIVSDFHPSPELSSAIKAGKRKVCESHVAFLKQTVPAARELSWDAALDDLEIVIGVLADMCSTPSKWEEVSRVGPAHAAAREGQKFTASEVYAEYVIFRRVLEKECEVQLDRKLTDVERATFHSAFDAVFGVMTASFARQRDARLELEATALTDFLSSLAHEVRNGVNGVRISLHLLETSTAKAQSSPGENFGEINEDIRATKLAIESTVSSLERILESDRTSHLSPRIGPSSLRPLMEGVARSAELIHRGKTTGERQESVSSRIKIDCPESLTVQTDPDLLCTILTNVLGNAVKYSDAEIIFRAEVRETGCRLIVADKGPGVAQEKVDKAFDKFERLDARSGDGLGLGLFIAKKAAKVLGATLRLESLLNEGTTVTVELPPAAQAPV